MNQIIYAVTGRVEFRENENPVTSLMTGKAEVALPEIESMTEEVKGAGISGVFDGHLRDTSKL